MSSLSERAPRPETKATVAVSAVPFGLSDIFKIGIGPSSSHTLGPIRAALQFRSHLAAIALPPDARVRVILQGSLAWTGRGHATDVAVILGLAGCEPETLDADTASEVVTLVRMRGELWLGTRTIAFAPAHDIVFDLAPSTLRHPNALTFTAIDSDGAVLARDLFFSVGGGFVERDGEPPKEPVATNSLIYPYRSAAELLALTRSSGLDFAAIARANEDARGAYGDIDERLDKIEAVMSACLDTGLARRGILPGGLNVRRRAAEIYARLQADKLAGKVRPNEAMDYVACFAMAVNEENAAGGRVVTAPTNGASGVIPAVLRYYRDFCGGDRDGTHRFLLTATVIGDLIKRRASISGAEVGCQGEVGSAAAMAAAGLCAVLGGTPQQVLNAAEIGLEHHLGMTCDPIAGLVQVPCIERNAFGAVKAISAASLALYGDGQQIVSLDQVIETMRQTGLDMMSDYRETARGGLAVNVPEC